MYGVLAEEIQDMQDDELLYIGAAAGYLWTGKKKDIRNNPSLIPLMARTVIDIYPRITQGTAIIIEGNEKGTIHTEPGMEDIDIKSEWALEELTTHIMRGLCVDFAKSLREKNHARSDSLEMTMRSSYIQKISPADTDYLIRAIRRDPNAVKKYKTTVRCRERTK